MIVCIVLDVVCLVKGFLGECEIVIDDFLVGLYEIVFVYNEVLIEVWILLWYNIFSVYVKVEWWVGDWVIIVVGVVVMFDG